MYTVTVTFVITITELQLHRIAHYNMSGKPEETKKITLVKTHTHKDTAYICVYKHIPDMDI